MNGVSNVTVINPSAKLSDLYALTLLDEGIGFGGAAVIMNQSTDNVRERIRRLEAAKGVKLWVRQSRRSKTVAVSLTPEGKALAAKAREILQIWESAA